MTDLTLTPEMIEAINRVAERHEITPETVLRRAISSYAAKMAPEEIEVTNVVQFHSLETLREYEE